MKKPPFIPNATELASSTNINKQESRLIGTSLTSPSLSGFFRAFKMNVCRMKIILLLCLVNTLILQGQGRAGLLIGYGNNWIKNASNPELKMSLTSLVYLDFPISSNEMLNMQVELGYLSKGGDYTTNNYQISHKFSTIRFVGIIPKFSPFPDGVIKPAIFQGIAPDAIIQKKSYVDDFELKNTYQRPVDVTFISGCEILFANIISTGIRYEYGFIRLNKANFNGLNNFYSRRLYGYITLNIPLL